MSLQVWLPLNGNLNNQGLANVTITNNGATVNDNGKIGKCYYFNGSSYIKISLPSSITSLKNTTICMWIKGNQAFGGISHDGNADIPCISCFSSWQFTNGSTWQYISGGSTTDGKWHHVACTIDNDNIATYIDGTIVTKTTLSSLGIITTLKSTNFIEIGCDHPGGDEYLTGYVNDFRAYDHCLSAKEVKEISKGLVCHYPLKSQYETGQVNKYSGNVAEGSLYFWPPFTKTKLEGERGYNYKLTYTGTGNNNWPSMKAVNFSFTAGKKYYYSCKVRCHSTNFNLYFRASRSDNDWATNSVNVLNPDGEWHEYVVYQTINETYDRSGSTVTCNPILEFYTENLVTSGKVYSADFDIKDVQVIESNYYVPFIDNSMASTIVSDCSGYGNNGTKVGNIAWSGDSPRYNGSYIPTNNSSYISTILNTSGYANSYTFSYWAKISNMDGKMVFGFGDGNRLNLYPTNSIFCWNTGDSADNPFQNNGTNITSASYNGAWHHYCITGNGTTTTLYIDGEKKGTAKTYRAITGTKLFLSGWNTGASYKWTGGNISDFRLYSTCLSEEDVKALYNTSASIDKAGVLSAYEFVEEG